jgi:hypothetical protein
MKLPGTAAYDRVHPEVLVALAWDRRGWSHARLASTILWRRESFPF